MYLLPFSFGGWGQVISWQASRNAQALGTEPPVCRCPHTAPSPAVDLSHQHLDLLQPGLTQLLCCVWTSCRLLAEEKCLPPFIQGAQWHEPSPNHLDFSQKTEGSSSGTHSVSGLNPFWRQTWDTKPTPTGELGEYHPSRKQRLSCSLQNKYVALFTL